MRDSQLLAVVALPLALCSGCADEGESWAEINPPVPVRVEAATRGAFHVEIATHGVVRSERELTIVAPVDGTLRLLGSGADPLRVGRKLARGEPLAEIDNRELTLALDAAEAELELAAERHEMARSSFEDGLISLQAFKQTEAELSRARSERELAAERLDRRHVAAPFAGTIVERRPVVEAQPIRAGTALCRLVAPGALALTVHLAEGDAARVRPELPVVLERAGDPPLTLEGRVSVVHPVVDPLTRTVAVEIELPAGVGLRPGDLVAARIRVGGADAVLTVPRRALLRDLDQYRVFVARDGGAMGSVAGERRLHLGGIGAARAEVLDGIAEGEAVIVMGMQGLFDGRRVKVVESAE